MAEMHELFEGSDHFHFADSTDGGYTPESFVLQVAVERHRKCANYLFVDGHVQGIPWTDAKTRLTRADARFVRPDGENQKPQQ